MIFKESWLENSLYFYSENEPPLAEDKKAYDGRFWHYGAEDEIVVWELEESAE